MSWERKDVIMPDQPMKPSAIRWGLTATVSVGLGIMLFFLHASGHLSFLQGWSIWLLACLPLTLCLLFFSLRSYMFGLELGQWEMLSRESDIVKREWNLWAERYISVIQSCALFPDKVTASFLLNHADSIEAQWGLVRRIDYLPKNFEQKQQAIHTLLRSIETAIENLPKGEELRITLLTDESVAQQDRMRALLSEAWSETFPTRRLPENINITDKYTYEKLEHRLKQAESYFELLLVMQLCGHNNYSDGLAIFLLAVDDMAPKYNHLKPTARLLRPMSFNEDLPPDELDAFFTMQTSSNDAKTIVGDKQDVVALLPEFFPAAYRCDVSLSAGSTRLVEMFAGIPGPFSDWLTIALAVDLSDLNKSSSLVISSSNHWINTVVSEKFANHII